MPHSAHETNWRDFREQWLQRIKKDGIEFFRAVDAASSQGPFVHWQNLENKARYSSRQIFNSISNTQGGLALTTPPHRFRSCFPSLTNSSSESDRTRSRYSSSLKGHIAIGLFTGLPFGRKRGGQTTIEIMLKKTRSGRLPAKSNRIKHCD